MAINPCVVLSGLILRHRTENNSTRCACFAGLMLGIKWCVMLGIKWCELKQGQRINLVNEGNALVNAVLHVSKPDAQGLVKVLIEVFCLNGGKWKTLWITEEHARIQNPESVYRRDVYYALKGNKYKNTNIYADSQEIKDAMAFAKSKQADQATATDVADVIVRKVKVKAKEGAKEEAAIIF